MRGVAMVSGVVAVTALAACGKDATGPALSFPALPAAAVTTWCVRGDRTVGGGISGDVTTADCPLGDGSFFETWHVRVADSASYRFAASSTFDNVLFLGRVDSTNATTAFVTALTANDDASGTNAIINFALVPNVSYFLLVNGFDGAAVGPYTVAFTRP